MDNFPASGRPAPGAQLTNPNSSKLLKNSRKLPKKFPVPSGRDPSSSGCAAGPAFKLRNSRKKTKVSAIFVLHQCQEAPGAPGTFLHTNPQKTPKNFFTSVLTCFLVKVYIPGRDTNKYPEDIERAEMLDFLLGILIPLKLLLLGYAAWQLLHWLL